VDKPFARSNVMLLSQDYIPLSIQCLANLAETGYGKPEEELVEEVSGLKTRIFIELMALEIRDELKRRAEKKKTA